MRKTRKEKRKQKNIWLRGRGFRGEARIKEGMVKGTGTRHRSRQNEKDNGILWN